MNSFQYDAGKKTLSATFEGRQDALVCAELAPAIESEIKQAQELAGNALMVQFDLNGVDFISSAFLRICMAVSKAVEPGNFVILNTTPFVLRTFKMAGLDQWFPPEGS